MKTTHTAFLLGLFVLGSVLPLRGADSTAKTKTIVWPPEKEKIRAITTADFAEGFGTSALPQLLEDGIVDTADQLHDLIKTLQGIAKDKPLTDTYVVQVLKWANPSHTTLQFDHWYLYDPTLPTPHFYQLIDPADWIKRRTIPGRKTFTFLYFQIPSSPDNADEIAAIANGPVTYTLKIVKQSSEFTRDLGTLLSIVAPGLSKLAEDQSNLYLASRAPRLFEAQPKTIGFSARLVVRTDFPNSQISITPSDTASASHAEPKADANSVAGGSSDASATDPDTGKQPVTASNATTPPAGPSAPPAAPAPKEPAKTSEFTDDSSVTYVNEPRAWYGLSFAVPVTSYNDLTVDQTNHTLVPKKIDRQNAYACLDFYIPAVEPSLRKYSLLPHPFLGLPIAGKPLRHPMAGVAVGYKGFEVFYSAIYDMENQDFSGARKNTWRSTYGVKITVTAAAALFKAADGK